MQHPTDRIAHTTAFVTPVMEHWLEREIAQWVHPMKDRSDDPSHSERTLLPRSSFVLHDWHNKGCGMCYLVYGMMHIKEPFLLINKSSPCSGGSGFHLSLSGPIPYV